MLVGLARALHCGARNGRKSSARSRSSRPLTQFSRRFPRVWAPVTPTKNPPKCPGRAPKVIAPLSSRRKAHGRRKNGECLLFFFRTSPLSQKSRRVRIFPRFLPFAPPNRTPIGRKSVLWRFFSEGEAN